MPRLPFIILFLLVLFTSERTQAQRLPGPWDTCLYSMELYRFVVVGDAFAAPGGGQQANIFFRSTSSPDQLVQGRGRLIFNPEDFPGGEGWMRDDLVLKAIMTPPEAPLNAPNWPGGQPPFPMLLDAFIQEGDGEPLNPWRQVAVRVNTVFFEDLTE